MYGTVLHQSAIDPARVVCEVTEQKSGSRSALFGFVEAVRERGLRIAVDDFGAADSDIRRIEELMPDIVKFDAQLVSRLMENEAGFALLKTMLEALAVRGIVTVLEGIEDNQQLELAEISGAAMVQGYALGLPELVPGSFFRLAGNLAEPVAEQRTVEREGRGRGVIPDRPFGRRGLRK